MVIYDNNDNTQANDKATTCRVAAGLVRNSNGGEDLFSDIFFPKPGLDTP